MSLTKPRLGSLPLLLRSDVLMQKGQNLGGNTKEVRRPWLSVRSHLIGPYDRGLRLPVKSSLTTLECQITRRIRLSHVKACARMPVHKPADLSLPRVFRSALRKSLHTTSLCCFSIPLSPLVEAPSSTDPSATMSKTFTAADVAAHKKPDDLYIIVDQDVYDLTKFQDE